MKTKEDLKIAIENVIDIAEELGLEVIKKEYSSDGSVMILIGI